MICLPINVDWTVFECILNLSLCVCYAGRWLTRWCSTLRWQSLGIAGQSMMERGASTQPTHCLWHPQGWAGKRQIHTILTTSHWMHSPWSHHCCPDSSPPPPPSQVDLDVTLPGEGGKDRPFKVSIKFVSLVSWHMLHEVLTGRSMPEPLELDKPISTNPVHAVDVVLRHLPSMK